MTSFVVIGRSINVCEEETKSNGVSDGKIIGYNKVIITRESYGIL